MLNFNAILFEKLGLWCFVLFILRKFTQPLKSKVNGGLVKSGCQQPTCHILCSFQVYTISTVYFVNLEPSTCGRFLIRFPIHFLIIKIVNYDIRPHNFLLISISSLWFINYNSYLFGLQFNSIYLKTWLLWSKIDSHEYPV